MSKREVMICSPVRTAIGTYNGSLKDTPAVELGATAIKASLERAGVAGKDVGTVVMGNVIQAGNKMNPARQAAIGGGIPVEVPAMTVNRVCGSGAQAIATASAEIQLGLMDTADRGRHGEHGCRAIPHVRRPVGLPHGHCSNLRRHAAGWAERRVFRRALGLAHRGPRRQNIRSRVKRRTHGHYARSSGSRPLRPLASSTPKSFR